MVVGLIPLAWIIGLILIEGCVATTFSSVASFGVSSHSLEVLAQHQEERLLNLALFQGGCLRQHQLPLLARQSSAAQQVPSLHLSRQRHLVVGQPVVELVMLGAVVQQGLAAMPLEATEVLVKVSRELDSVVVLEGLVQQLENLVEGVGLLHILQGKGFHQLPGCAGEAWDQVQDSFSFSFEQLHLGHVQGDPLPPLAVVTRGTAEQRHIVVLGHSVVTHGACRWWHSPGCSALSPIANRLLRAKNQQRGLLRTQRSSEACSRPSNASEACSGPRTAERPAQGLARRDGLLRTKSSEGPAQGQARRRPRQRSRRSQERKGSATNAKSRGVSAHKVRSA